jgi:GntR family transcriptional regulator
MTPLLSLRPDIVARMSTPHRALDKVLATFAVDRASPIPLWFQVSQHLERAIGSGSLPQGTLLENEIQLAARLGISRPTMRKAMEQLVDQGLVVRRRGIGTRVVQPKVRRPLELTSLHDDLASSGQKPATSVLLFEIIGANAEVASRLRIAEGDPVVHIERLRTAREQPIARMTNFLPADIVGFDEAALEESGLYDLLGRSGVHLHSATQTVGARTATAAEARQLGEARGAALLTMERETLDEHGTTVEYASHLYAASRYSFEINLVRT